MPRYDQYQLSNSRLVRPYEGSVLNELTSVAGTLQQRFDIARETDDQSKMALKSLQAAPFEGDQALKAQLIQQYTQRLADRAAKGDYENMERDTRMDARQMVQEYKPIADNLARYQAYQKELQDELNKGTIKDPAKVQKLLALSAQRYKGLERDPVTGEVRNGFSGIQAVKDIDVAEKIDKWMKDVAPTVIEGEVKYTDGKWMKYKEGRTTTLTQGEINRVIAAGKTLDPEFRAWEKQEMDLATVGMDNVDIDKIPDGPEKAGLLYTAASTGTPVVDLLKNMAQTKRRNEIYGAMGAYGSKYIRDDRKTGEGITGGDPYALQNNQKKLDDQDIVLSMPIYQPEPGSGLEGGAHLRQSLEKANQTAQKSRMDFDNFVTSSGIRPAGNGRYVDAEGNDRTQAYLERKMLYDQALRTAENLERIDLRARKATGFSLGKITPEMMAKAQKAAEREVGRMSSGPGAAYITQKEKDKVYNRTVASYLRENDPNYKMYDEYIKNDTEKGAQLVNIQNFTSKSVNAQATNLFKNLNLGLMDKGTQGLVWATGKDAGKNMNAEDYERIKGEAEFAGYGLDTDGELKFYYNVGKMTTKTNGETVGEKLLVKMPALSGTIPELIRTGQADVPSLMLAQNINKTINNEAGAGYINIGNTKIYVDRISKAEIGSEQVNGGILLRLPAPGGKSTEIRVDGVGEAVERINTAIRNNQKRTNQK